MMKERDVESGALKTTIVERSSKDDFYLFLFPIATFHENEALRTFNYRTCVKSLGFSGIHRKFDNLFDNLENSCEETST